jgi:5S rRNA maturation endonuclease (ribonuclease M5)/DNA-binding MarR family transcriptional regulator
MDRRFINHWGGLPQFQAPNSLMHNRQLALNPNAIGVLLVLLRAAKHRRRIESEFVTVKVGGKMLANRTGYSKNKISEAIRELERNQFIKCSSSRRKDGEFGATEFTICDSRSGEPLLRQSKTSLLYGNGVPYFTVPACFVADTFAHWSLARLSASEVLLYVSLLWLANKKRGGNFEVDNKQLREMSGLSRPTYTKTLEGLQVKGLIYADEFPGVSLCDPYTGEPLHEMTANPEDDPANYFVSTPVGHVKRLQLNRQDAEYGERLIRFCIGPGAQMLAQSNGDYMINCLLHSEDTPSLSISPRKRCFYCFGCKQKGTLTELLMLTKRISKAEALRHMAEIAGVSPEFHEPDKNAEAIYSYESEKGKLIKQVVRHPGKRFFQRQPARGGGWIRGIAGVHPLLYNLPMLQIAQVVCVVEGEKDADRVNSLHLKDCFGSEVATTTSGGSDSWVDGLAEGLREKRVVIMPDSDEPGRKYAEQIIESLTRRGIEFCVVNFAGEGVKDVSEYLEHHTPDELMHKIGQPWFQVEEPLMVIEA